VPPRWDRVSHSSDDAIDCMVALLNNSPRPLFPLGKVVATPGALEEIERTGDSMPDLLRRHVTGDFGTVCQADWKANEDAIANGERVFSAYMLKDGKTKVWIITEADRSSTCVLMPEDY
jgi:hypothetical protein